LDFEISNIGDFKIQSTFSRSCDGIRQTKGRIK